MLTLKRLASTVSAADDSVAETLTTLETSINHLIELSGRLWYLCLRDHKGDPGASHAPDFEKYSRDLDFSFRTSLVGFKKVMEKFLQQLQATTAAVSPIPSSSAG